MTFYFTLVALAVEAGAFSYINLFEILIKQINITSIPETIEQAVETLAAFYNKSLPAIKAMSQEGFEASTHFGAGMFIRDSWCLWWYERYICENWPKEKPLLVKHFHDLDVVHPDHMSSILMNCFYHKVHTF